MKSFFNNPEKSIHELREAVERNGEIEKNLEEAQYSLRTFFDAVSDSIFVFQKKSLVLANAKAEVLMESVENTETDFLERIRTEGLEAKRTGQSQIRLDSVLGRPLFLKINPGQALEWNGKEALLVSVIDQTPDIDFNKELLEAADEEKHRIGRDLHDGLSQCLASLSYQAKAIALGSGGCPWEADVAEIARESARILSAGAILSHGFDLPITDECSFRLSVEALCRNLREIRKIRTRFECDEVPFLGSHEYSMLSRCLSRISFELAKRGIPEQIEIHLSQNRLLIETVNQIAQDPEDFARTVDTIVGSTGLQVKKTRVRENPHRGLRIRLSFF